MSEHEQKQEKKLDTISERVYNVSAIVSLVIIFFGTIVNGIVRYLTGDYDFELIPQNILNFTMHNLWVFATPLSIKLVGNKLPLILQIVQAARGMQVTPAADQIPVQPAVSPVNQMNQMEVSNVTN